MFFDRFKQLCDQRGISCNRAAKEMGLSNATPTAWKKRGLTPKADTLAIIANYFDVTTDYLLGEEIKKAPVEPKYDEGTEKLIAAIRGMSLEKQKALADLIGVDY